MKLYKNKYNIGIYGPENEGETLLALVDNLSEFASLMGITVYNAATILHRVFVDRTLRIRFNGKLCQVDFVEVEEDA